MGVSGTFEGLPQACLNMGCREKAHGRLAVFCFTPRYITESLELEGTFKGHVVQLSVLISVRIISEDN